MVVAAVREIVAWTNGKTPRETWDENETFPNSRNQIVLQNLYGSLPFTIPFRYSIVHFFDVR